MQLYRYMARAILVPFVFEAPPMRVDTLDTILAEAHRALPEAISIGYTVKNGALINTHLVCSLHCLSLTH